MVFESFARHVAAGATQILSFRAHKRPFLRHGGTIQRFRGVGRGTPAKKKKVSVGFVGSTVDSRSTDSATLYEALAGYGYPIAGVFTQRASYRRAGVTGGLTSDTDTVAAAEYAALIKFIKGV